MRSLLLIAVLPCLGLWSAGARAGQGASDPKVIVDALCGGGSSRGPNANGALILAKSPTVFTYDTNDYCGTVGISECEDAVVRHDGPETILLNLVAAFPDGASPRVSAVVFGLIYNGEVLGIEAWGSCGDFELPDSDWPGPNSKTAVTWSSAQTTQLIEIYWFAAYSDASSPLILSPDTGCGGPAFADDDVPSNVDPIELLSTFGFGMDGFLPCPGAQSPAAACCFPDGSCQDLTEAECEAAGGSYQGPDSSCALSPCAQPGACCFYEEGLCVLLTEEACLGQDGVYQGDGTECIPHLCEIVPTHDTTWGRIKNTYRER